MSLHATRRRTRRPAAHVATLIPRHSRRRSQLTMVIIPSQSQPHPGCQHETKCPSLQSPNRDQAKMVEDFTTEQGWFRRCNGLIVFTDTGELLSDGQSETAPAVEPQEVDGRHIGAWRVPLRRVNLAIIRLMPPSALRLKNRLLNAVHFYGVDTRRHI